jgi:8-oxo-dGTP pyrophosphatase MutT (NUDIX family)
MARSERSAGVVVFRTTGDGQREFLLLDNGKFWDFPKGHLEKGETDLAAAMRELHEEANIDDARLVPGFSRQIRYFFRDGKTLVDKTVVYFLAEADGADAQVSDEHVGHEFLPFAQARQRLTYANAREILRLAEEFLKSEQERAA